MDKKSFGPKTFLYPMPVVIVGTIVKGKPNFNTIAYCGVVQSKPPMISLSMDTKRYTYEGIINTKQFSINIPSEDQLEITDFAGTYSGRDTDKSGLFSIFYEKLEFAPMITQCPVNMECELIDAMDFGGKNCLLVGKVIDSFCSMECLSDGEPDLAKIKPIIFTREDMKYWATGKCLGRAMRAVKK